MSSLFRLFLLHIITACSFSSKSSLPLSHFSIHSSLLHSSVITSLSLNEVLRDAPVHRFFFYCTPPTHPIKQSEFKIERYVLCPCAVMIIVKSSLRIGHLTMDRKVEMEIDTLTRPSTQARGRMIKARLPYQFSRGITNLNFELLY